MVSKQDGKVIKISIMWVFIVFIIVFSIIAFFKNYILATNTNAEIEEVRVFEENQNAVNILKIMIENNDENKKLINEEREIKFETVYEENPNLPKDEEQIKQEGVDGKVKITALQEYKNGEMIKEDILESVVVEGAIKKIIYIFILIFIY